MLPLLTLALHIATARRYGYFGDELYFIDCAKHLAWGYVDQPPLVAFAAWLAGFAGYDLIAMRLLPAFAAALTVWLAMRVARELGGGRFAVVVAATAVMLTPALLTLGNTLTTSSFEPLSWTLVLCAALRLAKTRDPRWWLALGVATAFGLWAKYSIALLALGLLAGFMLTSTRSLLRSAWFPIGILTALVLIAPNFMWQAGNGWPILDVLRNNAIHRIHYQNGMQLEYTGLVQNALAFLVEQFVYTNPLAAPLWIAGCVFLWRNSAFRFVPVAFAACVVLAIAFGAKGYYIIGFYPTLLAAGAVTFETATTRLRVRRYALAVPLLSAILVAPFGLPLLPLDSFITLTQRLGLAPRGTLEVVQPLFADQLGWDETVARIAQAYRALPRAQRSRTAIYADIFGNAGAIDFYGPRYGLPPAISGHNTYWLWGPRGYDGSSVLAVGASQHALLMRLFRSVRLVATFTNPYRGLLEGPLPIYVCKDPVRPLPAIWPQLRWYGS